MSLGKISRKNAVRFFVVALLLASFFTGTLIVSTAALNSNPQTANGQSTQASSYSSPLYPLPKSTLPASTLYTAGPTGTLQYTVAALQGIVARTQPQIFLTTNSQDRQWLAYIEQTYGTKSVSISTTQVLQQFKSYVTDSNGNVKIVVFDSNDALFPMQVNMATTLAGVYSALPVASSDLATLQSIFGSKINIIYDLRGQFSTKVSGYSWLWNLVGSQVTKQFIVMAPAGRAPLTDYAVEFKAFDFEICCVNAGTHYSLSTTEQNFVNQVFSNYPSMTPVLGFFGLGGEVNTVNYLSSHGDSSIVADRVADISVYSGYPDLHSLTQVPENTIAYNPSKVYVLWEITQGDALPYDFYNNYQEWTAVDPATNQPYRNEIPATWQINPIMAELAPPIMENWYATQSSLDDFITGPSGGAGYNHPDYMPNEAQQLALATTLDANAGINIHFDVFQSLSTSVYQNYIANTHPSAILLWQNSGRASQIVNGVPVMTSSFWEAAGYSYTLSDVSTAVSQIKSSGSFVYVIMNAQNPGLPFVQKVMNQLGPNYVPVSAQQYTDLYLKSMGVTTTTSHSTTTTRSSTTTIHSSSTSDTSSSTTHTSSTTKSSSSSTSPSSTSHTSDTTSSSSHTSHTTSSTSETSSTSKTSSSTSQTTSSSPSSSSTTSTSSTSSYTTITQSTSSVDSSSTTASSSTTTTTDPSTSTSSQTTVSTSIDSTSSPSTTSASTTTSVSSTSPTSSTSTWSESSSTTYSTTTSSATASTTSYWTNTCDHGRSGIAVSSGHPGNSCHQDNGKSTPIGASSGPAGITLQGSTGSGNGVIRLGSEILSGAIFAPSPQQPTGLIFGTFAAFGVFALGFKPIKSLAKRGEESQPSDGWRW